MTKYQAGASRRPYEITLLVVAVAAAGLNLRTAITSLPPLFPDLQTQLHLSTATLSLLAATPVICFGVVSAFTAWLNRRYGEEMILLVALVLLTAGLLLRGVAPGVMLFPGTVLAASAIAVLNVLLSSMAKRRWPERAGLLIGIYLTTLSAGAILSSLLSVPLVRQLGFGAAGPRRVGGARPRWPCCCGCPSSGTAPWRGPPPRRTAQCRWPAPARAGVEVYRYALTWQVTAFMALQSLLYYAALSWLPTIFQDRGDSAVTAGNLLALMGVGNLTTSLVVPVLAHRRPGQRGLVVPSLIGTAAGLAGVLWAPLGSAPFWVLVLGVSQGSCLGLAIFFMLARAPRRGRGRVAVRLRPVGRLPGRQRRPAGGRAAAQRHRQLEPPGGPAARAVRRRTRHRPARRPPAAASLGHPAACAGGPEYDTRVGDRMTRRAIREPELVHSVRLAFPPSGPYST